VPITTKVVSSNPAHGEVYSMQHYVIKLSVTCRWFSPCNPVFSINATGRHYIAEILLKVALSTIITPFQWKAKEKWHKTWHYGLKTFKRYQYCTRILKEPIRTLYPIKIVFWLDEFGLRVLELNTNKIMNTMSDRTNHHCFVTMILEDVSDVIIP